MSYPSPITVQQSRPGVAVDSAPINLGSGDVTFGATTGVYPDAIRVDAAGAVEFVTLGGGTDTWACAAGDVIPVVVTKIVAAGTTATGLHALYTYSGPHG